MADAATFHNLQYFPRAVSFFEESRHAQVPHTSGLAIFLPGDGSPEAALEAHADAYIRYLTEQGYAVPTVECYFRCVAHFLHWAVQQHVAFHDVGDALIDRFIHGHLPHCQCAPQCRRTRADVHAALMHFLDMYGIARATPAPIVSASIDAELAIFTQYMTEVRGLSESTRHVRRRHIGGVPRRLLQRTADRDIEDVPADVVRFVMRRTRGLTPGSVKSIGGSLRSYLRFKSISGTPVTALIAALPRVALWRLDGLPDVLSPEEVRRLLSAFDRSNATGMRDYAITRCLLDPGLRRTEVAHLCLDDIDWRAGILDPSWQGQANRHCAATPPDRPGDRSLSAIRAPADHTARDLRTS